jgi:hypothetical protein
MNENDNYKKELSLEIKKTLESSNISFLIGAGCSDPAVSVLGNIEADLQDQNKKDQAETNLKSIFKSICKSVIQDSDSEIATTKHEYKRFLEVLHQILVRRENHPQVISKQINIFTTNYDLFLEQVCDENHYIYNDGFQGGMKAVFNTTNYRKRFFQNTFHYKNTFELPNFNIYKLHGSVGWKKVEGALYRRSENDFSGSEITDDLKEVVVLPRKEKHEETLITTTFYDLLRLFANTLDVENTVLFVVGCSLRDEHIKPIIERALASNLTLKIFLIDYGDDLKEWDNKVSLRRLTSQEVDLNSSTPVSLGESKSKLSFSQFINFLRSSIDLAADGDRK